MNSGLPADELLALVGERVAVVRDFLEWALLHEQKAIETGEMHRSLRLENRPDIAAAARAAAGFPEAWWGVTVFTCFGSEKGTAAVREAFQKPLPEPEAWEALDQIDLPRGAIGHHRIQPGHTGARKALVAASEHADFFHAVLFGHGTFEDCNHQIRAAHLPQWGRTTTFDLLLRAGALGVGGSTYGPTIAHLEGSTGPKYGFEQIFDVSLDARGAGWCESVLRSWTTHWADIAVATGVNWKLSAYTPGDFENALCIYHETHRR